MTDAARAVRSAVLRAVPHATESIKWQAPNFATQDDFATFSMRRPGTLQIVLHTGAKPKPEAAEITIGDVGGRLKWAGRNRAVISFTSPEDAHIAIRELEGTIRSWVVQAFPEQG